MTQPCERVIPEDPFVVRALRRADLPMVREILFDRRVHGRFALDGPTLRDAVDHYLAPWFRGPGGGSCFLVSAHRGDEARPIGAGRIHDSHIDYFVAPDRWGRGVGTKLAGGLCSEALGILRMSRLSAMVLRENLPSRRILERLGFRRADGRTSRPRGIRGLAVLSYSLDRGDGRS